MIGFPTGAHVWIVAGVTDLRRGFTGLSALVETALQQDPFAGHLFVFRRRRGDLIKVLWWDGDGMCLFAKRLERGRFIWPQAAEGGASHGRGLPSGEPCDPAAAHVAMGRGEGAGGERC